MREVKIDVDDAELIKKLCVTIWGLDGTEEDDMPVQFIDDVTTGLETLLPEEAT